MNRRAFVTGLGAVVAAPLAAEAQSPAKLPRIGITTAEPALGPSTKALTRGLSDLGWVEGQNILVDYRSAEGPVGAGLVSSLARPGGNVTGLSMLNTEIVAKRLELLKDVLPRAERVAVLRDPAADPTQAGAVQATARALGLRLHVLSVSRPDEFAAAFEAARKDGAEALMVLASSFFNAHRQQLVDLAAQNRLATMYEHREFPDAGGLMSYGPNIVEMYRRAAYFVDKILRAPSPPTSPSSSRPNSSLSSTSRPPRCSASRSRRRCFCGRIKSSSDAAPHIRRRPRSGKPQLTAPGSEPLIISAGGRFSPRRLRADCERGWEGRR